jgi:hypothetical protein
VNCSGRHADGVLAAAAAAAADGVRAAGVAADGVRADGVGGAGVRLCGYMGGFSGEKKDDDLFPQPLQLNIIDVHASLAKSKLLACLARQGIR